MVDTDQKKVRSIFLVAVEDHAPEQWAEYLGDACRGEPALRQRVEVLLRGHKQPNELLDDPDAAPVVPSSPSIGEGPGTLIGPYKLLEQIGEGGFGVVFMAEQQLPVRRKVALKIVKPGMETRQVVARFEAERQALALMDHPNIAQIFDGGATESGRPYFVMELVRGIPITDFCDQHHLGIRERLELFIHVGQAVQHAHQKGVIHRDLKPSNVMVTQHDVTPVIKIIDFGIAKATGQQLTEKTLFTNFAQMIGTPMYMSPEQAQMSGLDVDTRSDVYSLGVLLYELLTGNTPFDKERLRTVAYDEMIRIIREEEPVRPSTRISTLGNAANRSPVDRNGTPQKLSQLLRGELDWIVMKALEKDRNRRYDSASALANEVQRYLRDEAVLACPPTVGYRLWKIARRHKRSVVAASLVLLALVGGIVGTTWGLLRATDARSDAINEAKQKQLALADREVALGDAKDKLYLALLNQARAERAGGRVGQRFEALKTIREAAKIRITPELRNEATAALIMPDAEIACEWETAGEDVINISFDATYTRYARLDRQGGVTVCRLTDGREEIVARLPAYGSPRYNLLRMSPDGKHLACGHSGGKEAMAGGLRVWNVEGSTPKILIDESLAMNEDALDYHADGRRLAVGYTDSSINVYDLTTGQRSHRVEIGAEPIYLAFHPSDYRLIVSSSRGVGVFDVATGQELRHWRQSAQGVAWHPDGQRVAIGGRDQKIHVWDVVAGGETMPPRDHGCDGVFCAFNQAGNRLLSDGWNHRVLVWDTTTGRQLFAMPIGCGVRFNRDGRMFDRGPNDHMVRLWRLAEGAELKMLGHRAADDREDIGRAWVHADGDVVAATSSNWLYFFSLASGDELAAVRLPASSTTDVCSFDRSNGWLTGGTSGVLYWPAQPDLKRPGVLQVGPPRKLGNIVGSNYASRATLSLDGKVLAVPNGDDTLVIDRENRKRPLRLGPQHDVRFCAVSPDHRWVATGSHWSDGQNKSLIIWDSDSGNQIHELPLVDSANPLFSPDGRWLATMGLNGSQLWETATWKSVRRFNSRNIIFSPDSQLLAMSDMVGAVRLVATDTGRAVAELSGPDFMSALQFTPDGAKLIVYCSNSKGLAVWDLRLIRQQLKPLGLDWDWPEFRQPERDRLSAGFQKVEVQLGDLATPAISREQEARQRLDDYRREVNAHPESAQSCNELAWMFANAEVDLRNVKAAITLAEKATRLDTDKAIYRNTLGVSYYRDGRFRDAIAMLRPNLEKQADEFLAFDLYFLAMSHYQLGESAQAQDYYNWAVRWTKTQRDLAAVHAGELAAFRAEAEALFKSSEKQSK